MSRIANSHASIKDISSRIVCGVVWRGWAATKNNVFTTSIDIAPRSGLSSPPRFRRRLLLSSAGAALRSVERLFIRRVSSVYTRLHPIFIKPASPQSAAGEPPPLIKGKILISRGFTSRATVKAKKKINDDENLRRMFYRF